MSVINNPLLLGQEGGGGYSISRSLRFNSSDSAYLSRTPASAGNRKTWTFAFWYKKTKNSQAGLESILGISTSSTTYFTLRFGGTSGAADCFTVEDYPSYIGNTTSVFRDPSAWYHFVVAVDTTQGTASDRVKVYVNGVLQAISAQPSQNFDFLINTANRTDISNLGATYSNYYLNGYLADIHFIDGQALDPTSFGEFSATTGVWMPKAYSGTYGTNGFQLKFADNSSNTATTLGKDTSGNGNNWTPNNFQATVQTGRLYAQASGTSTSAFSSATLLGNFPTSITASYAIYDADLVTPVTSATFSYLYSFSSVVEVLVSADGTNWTSKGNQSSSYTTVSHTSAFRYVRWFYSTFAFGITNNPAQNDSLVDVPVNGAQTDTGVGGEVRGNYATLNPLQSTSGTTLSNGNLDAVTTSTSWQPSVASIYQSSGKWYAECTITAFSGAGGHHIGIVGPAFNVAVGSYIGYNADSYGYRFEAYKYNNGTSTVYGASFGLNDVVGVAMDLDAGTLTFYKNGVSQGTAFTGLTGPKAFASSIGGTSGTYGVSWNFGQRPFAYTAPSGFKALCTANLPAPVVTKPSTVMDVKLYTGNGSTQTISGLGFSPDLVWIKKRNSASNSNHLLADTARGISKFLSSSGTFDENTFDATWRANWGDLTAFNSDGFTVVAGSSADDNINDSPNTHVAWAWDAGSSTVTNTQGSITSTVRANPSAGFSSVTYSAGATNATVGHGLGVAPNLIICKSRTNSSGAWVVYHKTLGKDAYLLLNSTAASGSLANYWGLSEPNSTTFGLSSASFANNLGDMVAYCFAPVAGYSSMGSYVGNGSADGPFVYCGFRPRWILIKSTTAARDWLLWDTARDPYNVSTSGKLSPNLSDAEYYGAGAYAIPDVCSNGFKIRVSTTNINANGETHIYCAFAESPFQYARAR